MGCPYCDGKCTGACKKDKKKKKNDKKGKKDKKGKNKKK